MCEKKIVMFDVELNPEAFEKLTRNSNQELF